MRTFVRYAATGACAASNGAGAKQLQCASAGMPKYAHQGIRIDINAQTLSPGGDAAYANIVMTVSLEKKISLK